jgi:hypothetical protein
VDSTDALGRSAPLSEQGVDARRIADHRERA